MSEESKDCLQCRLTSGGGLLAAGAYVVHQSRKVKTFSRHIITAIGYGFGVIGALRIFNLPPFKSQSKDKEKAQNKAGYSAGKNKTNQELIYLHMSNHYRRILNAKKVIDNSPPHSYKNKRPATSNPAVTKSKLNRPLDSPALTDRSASTFSYKGSSWGMESCFNSSRYHAQCIASDIPNATAHATNVDMDLVNRITYDTKHGPAAYCDDSWTEVKGQENRKMYQPSFETKTDKRNAISSSNSKTRPPNKASEESAQKQKLAAQSKVENPSNPSEPSNCDCTKICICDTNDNVFKKASPSGKEQSQTSSRDSAYNGGISSLPESRSPTPVHRRKIDCCCCCCEKKQRNVKYESLKPAEISPRVRDSGSCPATPKSKAAQQESLRKMKEDALYVKFLQDITMEVLERNLYTNKALKKVMKKHLRNNLHKLNKERMLQEIENLRIQLGIPEDKALLDLEAEAEEGSSDVLKPYPIISDSEFTMPKNLLEKTTPRGPKSVSEVFSVFGDTEKGVFVSETDEEEVISVIQMKKTLGEKRKETCGGKDGAGVGQGHSSDDSDRPSDPKKRSTTYGMKPSMFRTRSSSSSDSDMGVRDKMEAEVSASEELSTRDFTAKDSNVSSDRKNRSVSFWNNPDVNVSRTRTIEIKQKKTFSCSRSNSPGNEQRQK